jgi:hypothetical protein
MRGCYLLCHHGWRGEGRCDDATLEKKDFDLELEEERERMSETLTLKKGRRGGRPTCGSPSAVTTTGGPLDTTQEKESEPPERRPRHCVVFALGSGQGRHCKAVRRRHAHPRVNASVGAATLLLQSAMTRVTLC